MGLIPYLLRSVVQLTFMAMDFLVVMILVKVIYDRWQFVWLKPFANMAEPAVKSITSSLGTRLSKLTGKSYSEKTRLILLILCLWVIQCVVVGLLR
ncbi:MAG: hypothetical protein HQ515_22020 [Phycisphaeraceae bacterium]|nr:hypothetical protein [Phycisphaeraceae bacterium]